MLEKNRHTGCDWLRLVDLFQARGIAYSYTTHTHKPNRCAFLNWGEGGRGRVLCRIEVRVGSRDRVRVGARFRVEG